MFGSSPVVNILFPFFFPLSLFFLLTDCCWDNLLVAEQQRTSKASLSRFFQNLASNIKHPSTTKISRNILLSLSTFIWGLQTQFVSLAWMITPNFRWGNKSTEKLRAWFCKSLVIVSLPDDCLDRVFCLFSAPHWLLYSVFWHQIC